MLELISDDEILSTSRGKIGKKEGDRFRLYQKALEQYVSIFRDEINSMEKGRIFYRYNTMCELLGGNLKNNGYLAIYNGIRSVLWKYDITVQLATNTAREKVFILRHRREMDTLPFSLQENE